MNPHFGGASGRTLFVDLDDVLADFEGGFLQEFGVHCDSLEDQEMWRRIHAHGSFFRDLPPWEGALHFFSCLRGLNPIVLTACPAGDRYLDVASQKREWVREHLGAHVPVIPTPGSRAKTAFMHAKGDILIDDYDLNVSRWMTAGGFAIHHQPRGYGADIAILAEYLWPTKHASGTNPAPAVAPKTTSPATTTDTRTASLLGAATVNLPEEKPIWMTPA